MNSTAQKTMLACHLRWMIRRDMPAVQAIENNCFEFPCGEDDFIRSLRNRNVIGKVAEYKEQVIGYVVYELSPRKLRILNFAVHADWRYKGIGRQMVANLQAKLSSNRRNRLSLEIRETNLDAQLFFKAMGFECVDTIRGHYEDSPEDAYKFSYRFAEARQ